MLWYWFSFDHPLHLNLYGSPVLSGGPWCDREIALRDTAISLHKLSNGSHSIHDR